MGESYFISKVYRQHNSLVIVLPQPVVITLGIKPGNHVVFQWKNPEGQFELKKFIPVGAKNETDTRDIGIADRGGQT